MKVQRQKFKAGGSKMKDQRLKVKAESNVNRISNCGFNFFGVVSKSLNIKPMALCLFALCFQLWSFSSQAQQYPVQVTPVLLPPYSLRLSDYATSTENKLQLQLLMKDLLEPSHQVRLQFSLLSGVNGTQVAGSNPVVTGFRNIMLYPGTPLTLTNVDLRALFELQNLTGISAAAYAKPLPEGMYQFCFQVFDALTGRTLSARSCAMSYFVQYEPPMLNLPQMGEKVMAPLVFGAGRGVLFQWMPRQVAPNTRYIFTLKELWDNERDPIAGFLTSRTLWQEEVYANTLLYGIEKTALIPGKRYAWQVQAKSGNPVIGGNATEDNGVYKNNGLSEIFYFDYVEDCLVPSLLMAKNVGRGRTEIRWSIAGTKPNGLYSLQYRKRGTTTNWAQQESYQEMAIITGLEDVTDYEYRVGSVCGNLYQADNGDDPTGNAYSYSAIQYFTTDSKESQNSNYQCGIMPQVDISNRSPLQSPLGVNEVFMAGDFPVTVLEAQGSSGTYSGTGYIQVPYLADTRLKVSFKGISLNTDKKLISGMVETSYDVNETNVMFASSGIGETFGDAGIKTIEVPYKITEITFEDTPSPGKIVITGNSGAGGVNDGGSGSPSVQELPGGRDYEIKDRDGNIWNVDEKGNVTKGGIVAKGGASTVANTEGVSGSGSQASVTNYAAKGIKITWKENTATKYAFDTADKSKLGAKGQYPTVTDADGSTVYVPYKAVVNGQTDILDAQVSITDPALKDATIIFKTLSTGKEIIAQEKQKADTERSYQLTLNGVMDYAEEEVLAVLMPKDTTSKQQVISSFRLVHLSPKTINVTLVPTDEASKSRLQTQGEILNNAYGKIGVNFVIKEDPILDINSVVSGNTINSEDTELMSAYSPQQQQINALYKGTADRYVVFVTSKMASTEVAGYMRLNGQFGYVFGNAINKTTAHELGHGVFKLQHPWKVYDTNKKETNLLMDYSEGTELSHLDWKQVNDPALKIYSFQGQSSGQLANDGNYIAIDYSDLKDKILQQAENGKLNFVTPNGKIISLPVQNLAVNFIGNTINRTSLKPEPEKYEKIYSNEQKDSILVLKSLAEVVIMPYYGNGVLHGFAINEKKYEAIYKKVNDKLTFTGYYEIGTNKPYNSSLSNCNSSVKVIAGFSANPCKINIVVGKMVCANDWTQTINGKKEIILTYQESLGDVLRDVDCDLNVINELYAFNDNCTNTSIKRLDDFAAKIESLNTINFEAIGTSTKVTLIKAFLCKDKIENKYLSAITKLLNTSQAKEQVELVNLFSENKYERLKKIYDSYNAYLTGVNFNEYSVFVNALSTLVEKNFTSLKVPITTETLTSFNSVEGVSKVEVPVGLKYLYYLGLENNGIFKSTDRVIKMGPYAPTGEMDLSTGGKISLKETYWVDPQKTYVTCDGCPIPDDSYMVPIDLSVDPFEPIQVAFVKNYAEQGFTAFETYTMPAIWVLWAQKAVDKEELARSFRTAGNVIQMGAAVATLGESVTVSIFITRLAGAASAMDQIIKSERLKLKPQEYEQVKGYYEAWDKFYITTTLADGAVGLYQIGKNWEAFAALAKSGGNSLKTGLKTAFNTIREFKNWRSVGESSTWATKGLSHIDDWVKLLPDLNRASYEQILKGWNNTTLTTLNTKLAEFSGLGNELAANAGLLSNFNSLENTWWAKYALGGLAKRTNSTLPVTFKQMVGEIEITSLGQKLKLKTVSLEETSASYIGKLFDEQVETRMINAWKTADFSDLPNSVSTQLKALKNQGYELAVEAKLTMNGKNPVPDYLLIRKEVDPLTNAITYDLNNAKYIDCKYLWDSPFTASQVEIVNNVTNSGLANTIAPFGIKNVNDVQIAIPNAAVKIKTVEKLTVNQQMEMVIQ